MKVKWFTIFSLVLVLVIALSAAGPVAADDGPIEPLNPAPSAETGEVTDETPSLWFVEMPSNPTADGTSPAAVKREKDNFRAEARRVGLKYTERYAFDTLWNGLSIQASAA